MKYTKAPMRIYVLEPNMIEGSRKTFGVETESGNPIAHCFHQMNAKEAEANAHLFSAATKTLEALKACRDELYMIHSQYGGREHARAHSVALTLADEAVALAEPNI